jgi:hypothetical protein
MSKPKKPWKTRGKAILIAGALLLAAAVAGYAWLDGPSGASRYASVVSVERDTRYRDQDLIARAWTLPVAKSYRTNFRFQNNQSFCGPASVANVIRSTGETADQRELVDEAGYPTTLFGELPQGLTLDEVADLIRKRTGWPVAVVRDLPLDGFRQTLARANDPAVRIIANFHRGPLFATGWGHFSPVLGYLPQQDLAFVGDVNEDYGPFLVTVERLWQAAGTRDSATGKSRGLLVIAVRRP